MPAGTYNFTIEQGTTWSRLLYFAQNVGLRLDENAADQIAVDAAAKTFTRNDGGSWLADGLQVDDYLVNGGFENSANNGSHVITAVTATVITCAGSTLVNETAGYPAFFLKAMDLTGYTGAGQVRKKHSSTAAAATLTVAFDPIRVNGALTLSMSDTITAAIPAGETVDSAASQYVWDLELTSSTGTKTRALEGNVSVSPEATK
jgi:hypothetical protein